MPGKWAGLRGNVPPAPVESEWQQRVELEKTLLRAQLNLTGKGAEYCRVRDEKDLLEDRIKQLNVRLEALSQLMVHDMEGEGMDMLRLQDGNSLSIKDEPYVSIEDRDKFLDWIHESGQDALLTVHYQTMSSLTKDRLQNGQAAPPGLKVFLKQSITRRKART